MSGEWTASGLAGAISAGLVGLTAIGLLVQLPWRWRLASLGLQYVGVFILVYHSWSIQLSLTKLVAGWIATIVLAQAMIAQPAGPVGQTRRRSAVLRVRPGGSGSLAGAVLRVLAALMVVSAGLSLLPQATDWLGSRSPQVVFGGLLLLGLGLLQLGMSATSFGVGLGLLTLLSGFEILYAIVESSALVAGFLAAVTLGLALVTAYLLVPMETGS